MSISVSPSPLVVFNRTWGFSPHEGYPPSLALLSGVIAGTGAALNVTANTTPWMDVTTISPPFLTIESVEEDSSSNVTVRGTWSSGATGIDIKIGDVYYVSDLTTATWLNGTYPTVTDFTGVISAGVFTVTSISFADPTAHGSYAQTADTGYILYDDNLTNVFIGAAPNGLVDQYLPVATGSVQRIAPGSYSAGSITVDDNLGNSQTVDITLSVGYGDSLSNSNQTPTVGIYPPAEKYSGQNITLSSVIGASLYYTLDGTVPSNASTLYTAPFSISPLGGEVRAIAYIGNAASRVMTQFYS